MIIISFLYKKIIVILGCFYQKLIFFILLNYQMKITKKCKKCWSLNTKKNWNKNNIQRFKCNTCGTIFQNNKKEEIDPTKLLTEYIHWKQTYKQLAQKYKKWIRTIQRKLDQAKIINQEKVLIPSDTVLLVDTTYFGKRWTEDFFWITVFRDSLTKRNLLWKLVWREDKESFIEWIYELKSKWWNIKAIVTDWKKWTLWALKNIPSQMCHFHQQQILQRYLTKNPQLIPNRELLMIGESLGKISKETIQKYLNARYERNLTFLKERNEYGKLVHTRTISAYKSIKNNLNYLYTYQDYQWIIDIPRTTNSIESTFSRLKQFLWNHRWLTKERKIKFIISYLQK